MNATHAEFRADPRLITLFARLLEPLEASYQMRSLSVCFEFRQNEQGEWLITIELRCPTPHGLLASEYTIAAKVANWSTPEWDRIRDELFALRDKLLREGNDHRD